jgi:aminopeptidase N
MRNQIGDEAFFAFLSDYVKMLKNTIATGDNFFNTLSRHTDQDLASLEARYFQSR